METSKLNQVEYNGDIAGAFTAKGNGQKLNDMDVWKTNKMKYFALLFFSVSLTVAPAFASCVDITKGSSFSLTRNDPYFKVTNTVSNDGTVIEKSESRQNGSTQKVTTTYWNGVIAVNRKSSSSHVQLKLSEDAKSANLNIPHRTYEYPISILVNGNEVDRGSFVIRTIKKTKLSLNGCEYPVMIVRTSLERNNGAPINEEALLSLDAGMLLGNVAMTPDWKARHGVFFDEIETK